MHGDSEGIFSGDLQRYDQKEQLRLFLPSSKKT